MHQSLLDTLPEYILLKIQKQDVSVELYFNQAFPERPEDLIYNELETHCKDDVLRLNPNQLKFSEDLEKMLRISMHSSVVIYERKTVKDEYSETAWTEWEPLHTIRQFPFQLMVSDHNHLFSPNFNYFLTFS